MNGWGEKASKLNYERYRQGVSLAKAEASWVESEGQYWATVLRAGSLLGDP